MKALSMNICIGLVCAGAMLGLMARAGEMAEVNRTVEVYDREERFAADPAFQVPPGHPSEWVWRLTANAVGNWCHIQGTQTQEGGDGWDTVDFSRKTGYWRMHVMSANVDTWRHFQSVLFSGDLRPCGPGPGHYIGSFTIEAGTDTDYFLDPESATALIGTPVTVTAREPGFPGPDPEVPSHWQIAPAHEGIDPPAEGWLPGPSITFTSHVPGVYIVTGTRTGNPEHVATATVEFDRIRVTIAGSVRINPNHSPQGAFYAELPDGSRISRSDLQAGFPGYEGEARHIHLRPMGGGTQEGLLVNDAPYTLENNQTYDMSSQDMTVRIWNDHVNPQGQAVGQWWIDINARDATLTTGGDNP